MKGILIGAAMAVLACGAASAQGLPGLFQNSLAADSGPPGVTVTAEGHAKAATNTNWPLVFTLTAKSASAVQAATLREARLKQVRDIARTMGIELDIEDSGFSTAIDPGAQAKAMQAWQANRAAHPGGPFMPPDTESLPQLFVATAIIRVHQVAADKTAAFLDALKDAGVDDLGLNNNAPAMQLMFLQGYEGLRGFDLDHLDPATWAKADADAIANARRQAADLAAAAGGILGPVEKVTSLTRNGVNGEAVVTVSVRFGFTPAK